MSQACVITGDVMEVLRGYTGPLCHASIMDAPYGFDGGFMKEEWDKNPVVFGGDFWRLLSGVLHEGAIGASFMSADNSHKMSMAIESGGVTVLPRNYLWVQGGSMPRYIRVSATHVYGRTSLRPSVEPITLFQTQYSRKRIDVINETGAGTYNIGGNDTSSDGKKRFPSSFIMDSGSAEHIDAQTGRTVSPYFSVMRAVENSDEVVYVNKASRAERDAGLEDMEDTNVGVMSGRRDGSLGVIPRGKNPHPTIKPIEVAEHFARLLLPPPSAGERIIVVPFSGVGSEMIGALRAGWERVIGIEISEMYSNISLKRIDYHVPGVTITKDWR
jgi:hypothetical protein